MKGQSKTRLALLQELDSLRQRVAQFGQGELPPENDREALWEREGKYRAIVENVNSIILEMDSRGIVTFINSYALEFFRYSLEELLGKDVDLLLPPVESTG